MWLRCDTYDSTKIISTVIVLTVIDVLSKYAWAVTLKTKNGTEMATEIAKIIQDDGKCPKNLQTDMGKEFYNANVQILLKKHNINHYSTYSVIKASGCRTNQSYVEKRYVETVYAQWKL